MENPWKKIFTNFNERMDRYSLIEERPLIDEFNALVSDEFKIYDTIFPSAFSNIKTSDVLLLLTNPGFEQREKDLGVYDDQNRIAQSLKNLVEETVPASERILSDYWISKFKRLTEKYPMELIKSHISIVQFFPYHSIKYKEIPKRIIKKHFPNQNYLPSQEYTFSLLRDALKRKPVIIITRSKNQWLEALPELRSYEYCFETNNYRNPILSEKNFSKYPNAWEIINKKISYSLETNNVWDEQNFGVIGDPNHRFELYLDWMSSREHLPNFGAERFCRNKGITQEELGSIVREFESYDPEGKRWGKIK